MVLMEHLRVTRKCYDNVVQAAARRNMIPVIRIVLEATQLLLFVPGISGRAAMQAAIMAGLDLLCAEAREVVLGCILEPRQHIPRVAQDDLDDLSMDRGRHRATGGCLQGCSRLGEGAAEEV